MNKHLNIFNTYTKTDRDQKLENDLTRALAICLQEEVLFFHSILKSILGDNQYKILFSEQAETKIDLQKDVNSLDGFNRLYALSISGFKMCKENFHNQSSNTSNKTITDLTISINDILIIAEVKPNNTDCCNQLYKQSKNAIESNNNITIEEVIPIDLNWKELMVIAVQTKNFQDACGSPTRFLTDFIDYIRVHNHSWLPVSPFISLPDTMSAVNEYKKRFDSVLASISKTHKILNYGNRIGLELQNGWAQEIVFNFHNYKTSQAAVWFGIWPGNTKGQGMRMHEILKNKKNWRPPSTITIQNTEFRVKWAYEIKFCHFNKYIANLVISDELIKRGKNIMSSDVFWKYTGKYNRDKWTTLKKFLSEYLVDTYNWQQEMDWNANFEESNRNYLTLSLGYQIETIIPVEFLKTIDTKQEELNALEDLIMEIKQKYEEIFSL